MCANAFYIQWVNTEVISISTNYVITKKTAKNKRSFILTLPITNLANSSAS